MKEIHLIAQIFDRVEQILHRNRIAHNETTVYNAIPVNNELRELKTHYFKQNNYSTYETLKGPDKEYFKPKTLEGYYQMIIGVRDSGKSFYWANILHNEAINCLIGELEQLRDKIMEDYQHYISEAQKNIKNTECRYYIGLAWQSEITRDLIDKRIEELKNERTTN